MSIFERVHARLIHQGFAGDWQQSFELPYFPGRGVRFVLGEPIGRRRSEAARSPRWFPGKRPPRRCETLDAPSPEQVRRGTHVMRLALDCCRRVGGGGAHARVPARDSVVLNDGGSSGYATYVAALACDEGLPDECPAQLVGRSPQCIRAA
jgi:hypothetical protein